jgi:hypothetical protein
VGGDYASLVGDVRVVSDILNFWFVITCIGA